MKKYKLNMKNMMIGLGAATAIVAPVATLVACGGNSGSKSLNVDNSSAGGLRVDDSNIKALASNLTSYSVSDLFADAKRYNDNSMWTRGIAYHSLGATVSFIKGLAESYGWTRSDYAAKKQMILVDESNENKTDIVDSTNPSFTTVEAMRSIVAKSTPMDDKHKRDFYFEAGDDGDWGHSYDLVNIKSSFLKSTDGTTHKFELNDSAKTNVDVKFANAGGFYFADIKNPGDALIGLRSSTKNVERVIRVKDAFEKYPVITEKQLQDEIAPYAKAMIEKFLTLYKTNKSTAEGRIAAETLDQIEYLIDQNSSVDTNNPSVKNFKIDNTTFFNHLKELNNGSTHWLAIKSFFLGLDSSLVSGGYEVYNNFSGKAGENKWTTGGILDFTKDHLPGVKNMSDVMGLTEWAHWNQGHSSVGRMNFIAGMTLDEMDKFNGYESERSNQLASLILNNSKYLEEDTSPNHLWNKYDVTGKLFGEVSTIILKNKLIESNIKYLIADPNKMWGPADLSKSSSELQAIIVRNKFLETNAKFLFKETTQQKWQDADLSKDLAELQIIVEKHKVLDLYDKKYEFGYDFDKNSADEIKEIVVWNKYKDVNKALIEDAIKQLNISQSDIDSHKQEIRAIVDTKLGVDLTTLQAFINDKHASDAKFIFNPTWSTIFQQGSHPFSDAQLTEKINKHTTLSLETQAALPESYFTTISGSDYTKIFKDELVKLVTASGQTVDSSKQFYNLFVKSFDADTIIVSLEFTSKDSAGNEHPNTKELVFYRDVTLQDYLKNNAHYLPSTIPTGITMTQAKEMVAKAKQLEIDQKAAADWAKHLSDNANYLIGASVDGLSHDQVNSIIAWNKLISENNTANLLGKFASEPLVTTITSLPDANHQAEVKAEIRLQKFFKDNAKYLPASLGSMTLADAQALVTWNKHLAAEATHLGSNPTKVDTLPDAAGQAAIDKIIADAKALETWNKYLSDNAKYLGTNTAQVTSLPTDAEKAQVKQNVDFNKIKLDHPTEFANAATTLGFTGSEDTHKAEIIAEANKHLVAGTIQAAIDANLHLSHPRGNTPHTSHWLDMAKFVKVGDTYSIVDFTLGGSCDLAKILKTLYVGKTLSFATSDMNDKTKTWAEVTRLVDEPGQTWKRREITIHVMSAGVEIDTIVGLVI